MHACRMKKKEVWHPCKNCNNNVLWIRAEMIREHLLEKGFIYNYSIWTKHGETGENAQGNNTEQEREVGNDDSNHVFHERHGCDGLGVEELLRNIEHGEFLDNTKRGFNNLVTMEKTSKGFLYNKSKGCDNECTVLQMVPHLLNSIERNRGPTMS
jgi:hypothetical protein